MLKFVQSAQNACNAQICSKWEKKVLGKESFILGTFDIN
jgi:hypothetical protein